MKQKKKGFILLFIKFSCILLFPFFLLSQPQTESPVYDIVFFTGREGGTYYPLGKAIKSIIQFEYPQIKILCEPSNGSLVNAILLDSDRADLALMQSDVAYYLYTGRRVFPLPSVRIKAICSLYGEAIHVVTKENSRINSMEDLWSKTVSIGLSESGTEFNARIILDTLNLLQEITPVYESLEKSVSLLDEGTIDAFFVTTRVSVPSLREAFSEQKLCLLSFTNQEIENIRKAYPYFILKKIEANSYPNQEKDITTLGLDTLLVVNSITTKPKKIYQVTEALFKNVQKLKNIHPFISLDIEESAKLLPIPLHSGAKDYFKEIGLIESNLLYHYFKITVIILLMGFVLFILIKKFPRQTKKFLKNIYVQFLLLFSIFLYIGSFSLYVSERRINENFISISQSFWSCIVYLLSGFGDRFPISPQGKVISVFILILGVSIFGIISGRFASYFIDQTFKKKEKKMPTNLKGHIVICNWNTRGEAIINELFRGEKDLEITILTDADIKNRKELENQFSNLHFQLGDPAIHERLNKARISSAKSVVILTDDASQDPDAQTALIALAISKVCREKPPHIVAEVLNHMKRHHLEDAGVNEIICAVNYGIGLLAQSAIHPGLASVYDRLLSYSDETNEIYVIVSDKIPAALKNKTFTQASAILNKNKERNNPALILGIVKKGEKIINPKKNIVIEDGDDIIVLAYDLPDLSHVK